jgi:hypothetical protein
MEVFQVVSSLLFYGILCILWPCHLIPLHLMSQEVLEESMKSFEVSNATVTTDQCARPPLHYTEILSFVISP